MTQIRKVMVFGTFDILHAGHENMFKQARELGGYIIAVIARDSTVKKIKGRATINNESQRIKNLKKTELIDKIVLGDENDKYFAIKKYRPNIIALGYDQFAFTYGIKSLIIQLKLDASIHRLKPYRPDVYKSSLIAKRIHSGIIKKEIKTTIYENQGEQLLCDA
ncbi:MAG: cytidyltransferase-like protein, FAD synthetase [Candidatus Peregrinibacteria bacterium GW2011_GWC2_39_14]|nr:MAG: cytidyltransferase-like protein, FAD synthetase [Candidatus Peregrinibacteria bacterium GW2011_GWC2_39_14]